MPRVRYTAVVASLGVLCSASTARSDVDVAVVNAVSGADGSPRIEALRPALEAINQPGVALGELRSALEDPLPPAADPSAVLDAAADLRRRAFDAYAAFRYSDALATITSAETQLVSILPSKRGLVELGQLALLRAQVRLQSKDGKSVALAERDLRLASTLSGGAALDPGLYSPAVIAAYDRARATAGTSASLSVDEQPALTITVDGVAPPSWPAELALGRHYVVLSRPGFATERRTVAIEPGDNRLDAALTELDDAEQVRSLRRSIDVAQPSLPLLLALAKAVGARRLLLFVPSIDGAALRLYTASDNSLSAPRPATARSINELLVPVLDPGKAIRDPGSAATVTRTPSWIERNRTALLIGGGVVAVAIAGVLTTLAITGGGESGRDLSGFCGLGNPCD